MSTCSLLLLAAVNTMSISLLDALDDHAFKQLTNVTLSGQVVLSRKSQILLHDSTGCVVIIDTNRTWTAGDWCHIRGKTRLAWADERVIDAAESEFLRHTPPPLPVDATLSAAAAGALDYQATTATTTIPPSPFSAASPSSREQMATSSPSLRRPGGRPRVSSSCWRSLSRYWSLS